MKMIFFILLAASFASCSEGTKTGSEAMAVDSVASKKEIIAVMDSMQNSFKNKDANGMAVFFTSDGMFYGTDPGEIWNKKQFTEEAAKMFKDSANISYDIDRRDVMLDDDGKSAIVVEQFKFPVMSNKFMMRGVGRVDKKDNGWRIDFYSWNVIPKNEDIPKINKALQ